MSHKYLGGDQNVQVGPGGTSRYLGSWRQDRMTGQEVIFWQPLDLRTKTSSRALELEIDVVGIDRNGNNHDDHKESDKLVLEMRNEGEEQLFSSFYFQGWGSLQYNNGAHYK